MSKQQLERMKPETRQKPQRPKSEDKPFNGAAAVMSFVIPGLGQIYRGKLLEGFGFLLGYSFLIALTVAAHLGFVIPALGVWVFGIVHAGEAL